MAYILGKIIKLLTDDELLCSWWLSALGVKQSIPCRHQKPSEPRHNTSSSKCNAKILGALEQLYDEESVVYRRPLFHYETYHPILCVNSNNEPQKIGDKLRKPGDFTSVKAPKDGNLWIVFVLLRWQACLKDRVTPNFVSETKLRHFRLAGYIPITAYNYAVVKETSEKLQEFLSQAIKDKIQSLNN